jgi:hypothetical protein
MTAIYTTDPGKKTDDSPAGPVADAAVLLERRERDFEFVKPRTCDGLRRPEEDL